MTTPEQRQRLIDIVNTGLVSPSCVAKPDRNFSITINDAEWSSPEARAKALLPLALVQLDTAGTDRGPWVQRVVEETIRQIVPLAMRAAARVHPDERHRAALETAAVRCEREGTRNAARNAARTAYATYAVDADDAAVAVDAAVDAADAAAAAAEAAANAAAAHAAAHAAARAARASAARDDVLRLAVQIALDAYAAEGRTP